MIKGFDELEKYILNCNTKKTIAVACAADAPVLEAVAQARKRNVADAVLIGNEENICRELEKIGERPENYTIELCGNETECACRAVELINAGKADVMMKGLMQTSNFMRAVLDKEHGFVPKGNIVSEVTVAQVEGRMLLATDCAINTTPDQNAKVKLARNAAVLAKHFGIERPKVALISAVEKPTPKIISTIEAASIVQEGIEGCDVDGPMDFVTALDESAAKHKGISSVVAGNADILLMPDLCAANLYHKMLGHWTNYPYATAVCGTSRPIIMTSRADSGIVKYNSLLTALVQTI